MSPRVEDLEGFVARFPRVSGDEPLVKRVERVNAEVFPA